VGNVAELSTSSLARAIIFSQEVVSSVVNDTTFPMQMGHEVDPQMTLLLMAQAILMLFKETNHVDS
jgi:hypothetical protein